MHCQWGGKPQKLPLPLGFRHAAEEELSHGHRQHAQKIGKDPACGSGNILADRRTDTQTDRQTLITMLHHTLAGEVTSSTSVQFSSSDVKRAISEVG